MKASNDRSIQWAEKLLKVQQVLPIFDESVPAFVQLVEQTPGQITHRSGVEPD
ncbi:MAG: hypothetical protein M0R06_19355 [Sphaerochaeta sp.]|nr:hypothetical protein [Sphaerochaeta sp.]